MKRPNLHTPAFSYNGTLIRDRADTLNLTDMWKAAKAHHVAGGGESAEFESKRPAQWARLPETERRVRHLMATDNVGKSHIISGERGRTGETWAHWKLALEYAEDLSDDFWSWAKGAIRAHMEGQTTTPPVTAAQAHAELKLRITACNAGTRLLGEARRNGGPAYAAQIMPAVLNMLGIQAPTDIVPSALRQGRLFGSLPGWPDQPPH